MTGVFFGVVFGVLGALNVAAIVGFVERLFGMRFLDPTIYFITDLPSELRPMDVVVTAVFSFVMSAIATIYPSWRASKVNPAEALRYE
jgi:lipoprotein-releasing system permease protein